MRWLHSLLARQFVYERVRPWFLGDLDYSEIYAWLGDPRGERILDVGCGFGDALRYLKGFERYDGFDLDSGALSTLKRRHRDPNVHVHQSRVDEAQLLAIDPTLCVAIGLLHHIADAEARDLFHLLGRAPRLARIVTLDTVRVPGATINNVIAALDRGRFVREEEGYRELADGTPFRVTRTDTSRARARRQLSCYFSMCLERRESA
jgi:SAM-dependent methyltransferase